MTIKLVLICGILTLAVARSFAQSQGARSLEAKFTELSHVSSEALKLPGDELAGLIAEVLADPGKILSVVRGEVASADSDRRRVAWWVVTRLAVPENIAALERELLSVLEDSDQSGEVRALAAESLLRAGSARALESLDGLLSDKGLSVHHKTLFLRLLAQHMTREALPKYRKLRLDHSGVLDSDAAKGADRKAARFERAARALQGRFSDAETERVVLIRLSLAADSDGEATLKTHSKALSAMLSKETLAAAVDAFIRADGTASGKRRLLTLK